MTKEDPNPKVFSMRVFAPNTVVAKTRFWWNMKRLNKLKRANGQILAVNELYEKTKKSIKTYGIVLKYQSRTTHHNMYKEYRDVTLNGALSQLYQEMSGNHRANHNTIQIIRTVVLTKSDDIRRSKTRQYRSATLKFPIVKTLPRASQPRFRSVFQGRRPTTFKS